MEQNQQTPSITLIPAIILFGGLTLILMALFSARPSFDPAKVVVVPTETAAPTQPAATATPQTVALAYDPAMIAAGETLYQTTCSACHGFNAKGIPGLGKTLIGSEFVDGLSDADLVHFLTVGRDIRDPLNTTGMVMPALGGNPGYTEEDMLHVVAYIRSLNTVPAGESAAVQPSATPQPSGPQPTATEWKPPIVVSSGSSEAEPTTVAQLPSQPSFSGPGASIYVKSCSGCHGVDGAGLPYMAGSLADSELVTSRNGFGLENFLTMGGPPINPEVAYPHPYRGGYPELSNQDIRDVIAYLYTLPAVTE